MRVTIFDCSDPTFLTADFTVNDLLPIPGMPFFARMPAMTDVNFCEDLRDEFAFADRTRGDAYYRSGRVAIGSVAAEQVTAKVRGSASRRYDVEVKLDRSRENVRGAECSCPQFDRAGSCKHVWAVLRALDELIHTRPSVPAPLRSGHDDAESREIIRMMQQAGHSVVDGRILLDRESSSAEGHQAAVTTISGPPAAPEVPPSPAPWKLMIDAIQQRVARVQGEQLAQRSRRGSSETVWYLLDLSVQNSGWPRLHVLLHDETETPRPWHKMPVATHDELEERENTFPPIDANIITELLGANPDNGLYEDVYYGFGRYTPSWRRRNSYRPIIDGFEINDDCSSFLLREIAGTGRLYWRADRTTQPEPLKVERFATETLQLQIVLSDVDASQIRMTLQIAAGEQVFSVREVVWAWESGTVLLPDLLGKIDPEYQPWLQHFMQQGDQLLPAEQRDGLIQTLLGLSFLPRLVWPESWGLREQAGVPQPVLKILWPDRMPRDLSEMRLAAKPLFRYGQQDFPAGNDSGSKVFDPPNSRFLTRDSESERAHLHQLIATDALIPVGVGAVEVKYASIPELGERLSAIGWLLEAEGRPLVAPGMFSFEVTSGLDWFDLSGGAAYADQIVPLPVLLQAVRRKENFVRLDDGSHGLLPTEWVERFGKFLELATADGDTMRFGRAQALLLDSLLQEQAKTDPVKIDAGFRKFRKQLAAFEGIKPGKEPKTFQGELREYQRDGLGWFGFLQEFGFGGCLADDMGLGKTIQVLSLLEQRRARRLKKDEVRKPSLVVVPKSLVFNWIEEAEKFAPKLNVVDFTGITRRERVDQLATADIVLTTYGTLRKDIERLSAIEFDYAILDEAQAIKNPKTDAAKSCYLLRADHRLAMTGTPIENHLGDLWSQFRFLNPGLLGHSQAFAAFNRADCEPESLQQLSKAIRPFILRRTKNEVLKELPDKTEQTLFCEMSPKQARQYNELRDHYRIKLGDTVRELGISRSKIHVLEALLRLRQAACDGRLVNPKQAARGAKLDLLLELLEEVMGEGHKVLVFSQFTSLLGLLENDLKQRKIRYEYLDGKTNDRKSRVNRFQKDDGCQLFLISLKAGGHGLNLTAADYVYMLDPWWNPAAEAQAIDRAHRIGQTKNVFAYRMIAKGTVEEKILELQKTKRDLADSIISGNNSLIRTLTADDLQMLLG